MIFRRKMTCNLGRSLFIWMVVLLAEVVVLMTEPNNEPHDRLGKNRSEVNESSFHSAASRERVGIRFYRRFHANDSLIGRPVPCTREEKLCFRYNSIYSVPKRKCVDYNDWISGEITHFIDSVEFLKGNGHIRSRDGLSYKHCPGYRMAFDGRCYMKEVVKHFICACAEEPAEHLLGGKECRCTSRPPIHVEQPAEDGRCRIPDLLSPQDRRLEAPDPSYTPDQLGCCRKGAIWVPEGQGCFRLLERGPCAHDHVVALDKRADSQGRVEGTCVHVRGGCPQGHVRMAYDEQCHDEYDVNIIVPSDLRRDQFGMFVGNPQSPEYMTATDQRRCMLAIKKACHPRPPVHPGQPGQPGGGGSGAVGVASLPTHCNGNSRCRYEVFDEPPQPEDEN